MQYSRILLAGLVSLGCSITTAAGNGKHSRAKRSFTSINGPCTAVCQDNLFNDCTVHCSPEPTPKPTPVLQQRAVVTVTNNGCTAVCWDKMPGTECDVNCGTDFGTHMLLPTPKPAAVPALLHKRRFTGTSDGCTAVCWDLMPGTGCDVQCRQSGITAMPASTSGVSSGWKTTFTTDGCTVVCQDLMPGSECGFRCPNLIAAETPAPAQAGREAVQAREAHDARLARKFGLDARDDKCTPTTVTVTSIPAYCTVTPAILPAVMPQEAGVSMASAALVAASVAISEAATRINSGSAIPPAASAALSEAASFLSYVSQAAVATPNPSSSASILPSPASSITVATVSLTSTGTTITTTAALTSTALTAAATTSTISTTNVTTSTASSTAVTTTAAATTTAEGPVASMGASSTVLSGGASPEGMGLSFTGFLLSLVVGMAGNVALML